MKTIATLIMIIALLVSGCTSQPEQSDTGINVPFERVEIGIMPTNKPLNTVLKSEDDWISLCNTSNITQSNCHLLFDYLINSSNTSIDFNNEMLIVVWGGSHPTGGYFTQITRVALYNDSLVVEYYHRGPKPGQAVTQAFTITGDIVKIKKYDLPVTFKFVPFSD